MPCVDVLEDALRSRADEDILVMEGALSTKLMCRFSEMPEVRLVGTDGDHHGPSLKSQVSFCICRAALMKLPFCHDDCIKKNECRRDRLAGVGFVTRIAPYQVV